MADLDRAAISAMRKSYGEKGLVEGELNSDPILQFQSWLADAANNPVIVEANAMVLSTLHSGAPIARTVLLKDVGEAGFTFFTNYNSRKSHDIEASPAVSLLFPWYAMERQVIVTGVATRVASSESDSYFATRPWSSQIGAWASEQSQVLESRSELEKRWAEFATQYPEGTTVPRPSHWGGFIVRANSLEFWQGRYSRLHDRIRYSRVGQSWEIERFFP